VKSGKKTLGHVQKSEKLTVEQVNGPWLFVGQGWVYAKHVISAPLMDWYERLPDRRTAEHTGRIRGKFDGVLFAVTDAGSDRLSNASFGAGGRINGWPMPNGGGIFANARNVGVFLRKAGHQTRELLIAFPGSKMTIPDVAVLRALKSYGMMDQGDYVVIDASSRTVHVNGQQRRPR